MKAENFRLWSAHNHLPSHLAACSRRLTDERTRLLRETVARRAVREQGVGE